MIGLILLGILFVILIIGYLIPESRAYDISSNQFAAPSLQHPLGTDRLGRDNLSRIAVGARSSLSIGAYSVLIGGLLGISIGMIAGWYGGIVDLILQRLLDTLKAIPNLLLAMMIIAVFGNSLRVMIVTISIIAIPLYARMARSVTLTVKIYDYILWAKHLGLGNFTILRRHVLPNIFAPLVVTAALGFSNAVLTEASLSYLGMGIPAPMPSWGRMLAESQAALFNAPWLALSSAFVLTILVLGFNLISEGLQHSWEV
jgi:peptide/nickel transport system permease protein